MNCAMAIKIHMLNGTDSKVTRNGILITSNIDFLSICMVSSFYTCEATTQYVV